MAHTIVFILASMTTQWLDHTLSSWRTCRLPKDSSESTTYPPQGVSKHSSISLAVEKNRTQDGRNCAATLREHGAVLQFSECNAATIITCAAITFSTSTFSSGPSPVPAASFIWCFVTIEAMGFLTSNWLNTRPSLYVCVCVCVKISNKKRRNNNEQERPRGGVGGGGG